MTKFHLNPEKGPLPCSAQTGQCPYGAEAPHFSNKIEAQAAYEADLTQETKPLGSLRRSSKKSTSIQGDNQIEFGKTFERLSLAEIEQFVNESKHNRRFIDNLIKQREDYARQRLEKLAKVNPSRSDNSAVCDRVTFSSLQRDFVSYQKSTNELIEVMSDRIFRNSNLLEEV